MKILVFIALLGVAAWYGMTQFNNTPPFQVGAAQSDNMTKTVGYAKCTTADGRVFYGQAPAGTTCTTLENVTNDIIIAPAVTAATSSSPPESTSASARFQCDGRQFCSQMTSREEAGFFLANCPNMQMDGDGDGIPCENDSRF